MTSYLYARVSTFDQNVEQQITELMQHYPYDQVFSEKASGKTLDRPEFERMKGMLVSGDSITVMSVSRLGRNTSGVLAFIDHCKELGVSVRVHDLGGIDVCSPTGKMVLTVLAGVAEMQRDEMLEKQRIGIERAKVEKRYTGRRQSPETVRKLARAVELMSHDMTREEAAKAAGVGVATLYRHLKAVRTKSESEVRAD
ncbi:recombinase family protein [Pontibacterium sp.]|uniref:recombinase family protein n=1 Tax=Pontibacterium sp. TaxID=2036026 RepID=UPI003510E9EC